MKKKVFIIFLFCFFVFFKHVLGVSCEMPPPGTSLETLQEIERECERLKKEMVDLAENLNEQIASMDNEIKITSLKISQTEIQIKTLEDEINVLSGKIIRLDGSLNFLSKVLLLRVAETYKKGKLDLLVLLASSKNFSDFISRYRYLQSAQMHDREMLLAMEQTKTSYNEQKQLKEKKQTELEKLNKQLLVQKKNLATQIADRKKLYEETKGKQAEYERLLAATKEELEAIQRIIAGKGEETEVRKVNEGDRIATVILGSSACSTGTHLHFEVRENGEVKNPFSYLRNINLIDNSGGDPYTGGGNWSWPLNEPIRFTQGYGQNTSAIRSRIVWYKFHTGIDIVSEDRTVKAVKSGTLYRGGVACGNGTLRYVRVRHEGSNIDTYYLHVNYY